MQKEKLLTAKMTDYKIVEIISKSSKTSIVREITTNFGLTFRTNNKNLYPDEFIPLNEKTAKQATLILKISNPEWGVKKFNYKEQQLNDGSFEHTFGVGSNSALLFKHNMEHWRVIK